MTAKKKKITLLKKTPNKVESGILLRPKRGANRY